MAEYPIEFTAELPQGARMQGGTELTVNVNCLTPVRIALKPSDHNHHALARVTCFVHRHSNPGTYSYLRLELGDCELHLARVWEGAGVDKKIDTPVLAQRWFLVVGEGDIFSRGTVTISNLKLFAKRARTAEEVDHSLQKINQYMEALVAMRMSLLSQKRFLVEQAPDIVDFSFKGSFYWEFFLRDKQGTRASGQTLREESQSFSSTAGANPRGIFVFSAPGHPPARWTALLRGLQMAGVPFSALFERKAKNWEMHFGRAVGELLLKGLAPCILHKDGTPPTDDTLGEAQKDEVGFWNTLAPHHQQSAKHMVCSDFFYEYLGFQERLEVVSAELTRRCEEGAQDQDFLAPSPLVSNEALLECVHLAGLLFEHKQAGMAFLDTVKSYAQHCARVSVSLTEASEAKERAAGEKEALARGLRETIKAIEEEASKLKDSSEDSFKQSAEAKERGEWVLAQVAAPPQPEFF